MPLIVDGLDDEAKGGADGVDIFTHNPLHNSRLAGIIETTRTEVRNRLKQLASTHSIRIRSSLSFNLALRRIDSMVAIVSSGENRLHRKQVVKSPSYSQSMIIGDVNSEPSFQRPSFIYVALKWVPGNGESMLMLSA